MAEANRKREQRRMDAMVCPLTAGEQNADILLDYCNRKLEPELAAILESHMAKCAACEAFTATQTFVWNALDSYEALPVSDEFDRTLWAKIEAEDRKPWWKQAWYRLTADGMAVWQPAVPVALVLLVAVGLLMRPNHTPPVNEGQILKAEAVHVDVEQVETALQDLEMLRQLNTESQL